MTELKHGEVIMMDSKKAINERSPESQELAELKALINNPSIDNFLESVRLEAAYQSQLWEEHDKQKQDTDWYRVLTEILGVKILSNYNNPDKQLHHIISCAALLYNWFKHKKQSLNEDMTTPIELNNLPEIIGSCNDERSLDILIMEYLQKHCEGNNASATVSNLAKYCNASETEICLKLRELRANNQIEIHVQTFISLANVQDGKEFNERLPNADIDNATIVDVNADIG